MIQRYSRPEMRAIWTDENKLQIWLKIELLASEALVKEGVVPEKDFAKIKAGTEQWNADPKGFVERAKEILRNLEESELTPEGKIRQHRPRREVEALKKLGPPPQMDLFA